MIDEWQAINIIAERAYENRKQLKQARRQRRTEFVDIYGVPMPMEAVTSSVYETRLFISLDHEYWERFGFKLRVVCDQDISPDEFVFKIGERDSNEDSPRPIDISEYLEGQYGYWVEGDGYYPTDTEYDLGNEDVDDPGYYYDILDACSLMWAEGRETAVNQILRAGTKVVRVECPIPCEVTFVPFIKYSTINR